MSRQASIPVFNWSLTEFRFCGQGRLEPNRKTCKKKWNIKLNLIDGSYSNCTVPENTVKSSQLAAVSSRRVRAIWEDHLFVGCIVLLWVLRCANCLNVAGHKSHLKERMLL